jgi:cobalamin biosynthesis protein CobT
MQLESDMERIGRVISNQYGVTVKFGGLASTNGDCITLPSVDAIGDDATRFINGYLDHEVAHVRYSTFNHSRSYPMTNPMSKYSQAMANAIEDMRVEKLMLKDYPGCIRHLEPLHKHYDADISSKFDELDWKAKVIMYVNRKLRGVDVPVTQDETYHKAVKLIDDSGLLSAAERARNTSEVVQCGWSIVNVLKHLIEGKAEEDEKEDDDNQGGDSGDDSKDDGEKGNQEQQNQGGGDGEEEGNGSQQGGDDPVAEHSIRESIEKALEQSPTGVGEHFRKMLEGPGGLPTGPNRGSSRYTVHSTKHDAVHTKFISDGREVRRLKQNGGINLAIKRVTEEIASVFSSNERRGWRHEQERGQHISVGNLARFASTPFNKPFKVKSEKRVDTAAVTILVDESGSMSREDKYFFARETAYALAKSLSRLSIPCEVIGFSAIDLMSLNKEYPSDYLKYTRGMTALNHNIFKSHDETETALNNLSNIKFRNGGNADG